MKLDEVNYTAPGGEQVSGDDIHNMVKNFVGKGKSGTQSQKQTDPAVSNYHKQQDHVERTGRDSRATSNMKEESTSSDRRSADGDRPWRKDAPPVNKTPSNPNYPSKSFNHDDWMKSSKKMEEGDSDRPWRKDAPPVNKTPSNPNYPTKPFNHDEWMKSSKKMEEDSTEVPEVGRVIRTKRSQMEGKVESVGRNEVFFRLADGRLMKTPLDNVIVIEELADEDTEMMEDRVDEISTEVLRKYKTAAAADARSADKSGDTARGNKRFSGIVKATNKQFDNDKKKHTQPTREGTMSGINRAAPAQDVGYEKILDEVKAMWKADGRG